jgi:hypothetical protein
MKTLVMKNLVRKTKLKVFNDFSIMGVLGFISCHSIVELLENNYNVLAIGYYNKN